MAAYRFLDNPDIGVQEILSGHTHATRVRIRAQEVVLLVQDTTFLDDGTMRPKAGMGSVKIKTREEYLLHPPVAFTPERVNIIPLFLLAAIAIEISFSLALLTIVISGLLLGLATMAYLKFLGFQIQKQKDYDRWLAKMRQSAWVFG